MDLTDAHWEFIAPQLPKYRRCKGGRGRPRKDLRENLHGVFRILRTGAQWGDLPGRYQHRWKVERLFAWLQIYRRLITRHAENFLGFVRLGGISILRRHF